MKVLIFWFLLILLVYAYILYPIIVGIISAIKKLFTNKIGFSKNEKAINYPALTIIIPAYNEAKCIVQKIENTLKLDYPSNLIQIIVVADGCTDDTISLIKNYQSILVLENEKKIRKICCNKLCYAACIKRDNSFY